MTRLLRIACVSALPRPAPLTVARALSDEETDVLVITHSSPPPSLTDQGEASPGSALVELIEPLLDTWPARGPRVLSDAARDDPQGCADALRAACERAGVTLRVAVLHGDDLKARQAALRACRDTASGDRFPDECLLARARLGAPGIVAALERDADIVLTGYVADGALVCAALIHGFGWSWHDYARLAQGALAGHLLGATARSLGNPFTDWERAAGRAGASLARACVREDGRFTVGDRACPATPLAIGEGCLQGLEDPRAYRLPDVIGDFTRVTLAPVGPDRVEVQGARGLPPDGHYRIGATYRDGFRCAAAFLVTGPDAPDKARRVARVLLERGATLLAERDWEPFSDSQVELLGEDTPHSLPGPEREDREIVINLTARHARREALALFAREIATALSHAPSGVAALLGGRPVVYPMIGRFSGLAPKSLCQVEVSLDGVRHPVALPSPRAIDPEAFPEALDPPAPQGEADVSVPLKALAVVTRVRGEGRRACLAVMARRPGYLPWIAEALGNEALVDWLSPWLDPGLGRVTRGYLPGSHGLTLVVEHLLAGGRPEEARGGLLAHRMLAFPVPLPRALALELPGRHGEPRVEEPGGRVLTERS